MAASLVYSGYMQNAEHFLSRWHEAGLLDDGSAAAIRSFEAAHAKSGGRQWQVLTALILGAILLGAGVLLFVAAHWDQVSPASRMVLTLSMLVFFHGLGLLLRERFAGLSTAMHSVGTVSAGAAIALVGQIFNMQEHWPAAVMLWALCAAAGWALLRDQFQQTFTLLLVPAWLVSEWAQRTERFAGSEVYIARVLLVLGVVYLAAFLHHRKRAVSGILFAAGALLVPISIGILAAGFRYAPQWGFVPLRFRLAALALVLLAGAFGWFIHKGSVIPAAVAGALAWALPWAQKVVTEDVGGHAWTRSEPSLAAYILVAAAAVFLVWWGIRTLSKALINYGMVAFAATVFWFYFSSIMDKLGRSLGLIVLGALFLAGGWALEQTRRKLVHGIAGGVA